MEIRALNHTWRVFAASSSTSKTANNIFLRASLVFNMHIYKASILPGSFFEKSNKPPWISSSELVGWINWENYVFQVQKLLTCLDSFVLRRKTSSVMRRLSRLIPAGCVFSHPQSAQFFVVVAAWSRWRSILFKSGVRQAATTTKNCALCGWEKIRIPWEWGGWVGALLRKSSVGGRNCLNKWIIFGLEKHNFPNLLK